MSKRRTLVAVRRSKVLLQEVPVDVETSNENDPLLPADSRKQGGSKRRKAKSMQDSSNTKNQHVHSDHSFSAVESARFASDLLQWYDGCKRDLPWRQLSPMLSYEDKAYSVLVSEVMLQQTQVVTVLSYYKKWMSRWPTFSHLAKASLEEVNELWAGMGYYSRARRLLEAARKVDNELGGKVPLTNSELQSKLPGVGRYTAGAVASIAFGQRCPAVDGNVIRVLARMRCLGADSTSKIVLDHVWKIADLIVPNDRPGDFNQAMMDLGATVCTPRKPVCNECPVSGLCLAYQRSNKKTVLDIEEVPCELCCPEPLDNSFGVMNFPRKAKKAPPRKETSLVCVVHHVDANGTTRLLLSQRPQGGLLAGLWEFPSLALSTSSTDTEEGDLVGEERMVINELLEQQWGIEHGHLCDKVRRVKVVLHIFSHIRQQYVVYAAKVSDMSLVRHEDEVDTKWVTKEDLDGIAISRAMKKVFQAFVSGDENDKKVQPSKKSRKQSPVGTKKLTDFFQITRKE